MKNFHALSLGTGIASGMFILFVIGGGLHVLQREGAPRSMQQFQGGAAMGRNTSQMAERMGMTEAELQQELDAGKTMQQIATERGVAVRGPMSGSGRMMTGSGGFSTGAMMMRNPPASSLSSSR